MSKDNITKITYPDGTEETFTDDELQLGKIQFTPNDVPPPIVGSIHPNETPEHKEIVALLGNIVIRLEAISERLDNIDEVIARIRRNQ